MIGRDRQRRLGLRGTIRKEILSSVFSLSLLAPQDPGWQGVRLVETDSSPDISWHFSPPDRAKSDCHKPSVWLSDMAGEGRGSHRTTNEVEIISYS